MKRIYLGLITLLTAYTAGAQNDYYFWDKNYTAQALLGVVEFEDFNINDATGSGDPATINFSTLPQIGGAWTTLPKGDRFQYGLECSFLLGFRFDKVNYASVGGSGLYVRIEVALWTYDLAGGAYASLYLDKGKRVRIYGGGGPLVTYADYRSDREETDNSGVSETYDNYESVFGLGVYARAGFEFRLHDNAMLGLGARGTWADVDFNDTGDSSDLIGIAGFVTFTAGF